MQPSLREVVKIPCFGKVFWTVRGIKLQNWRMKFFPNSSDNRWSTCSSGYFLQGLYRSDGDDLHNIEYGKCCKPANHPYLWGGCYHEDIKSSFNKKGWSKCSDGYYMTGLFRGTCNKLSCIEKIKCCMMYLNPPVLTSLSDVKTRVMDLTMNDLAYLAHYLGYGWCGGCRAQYVGEDFRRKGDEWHANTAGPCDGYKANHRLKLKYRDFKLSVKDIKYGSPVNQTLQPTVFSSGKIDNDHATTLEYKHEEKISSVRTVTHTTTSSWIYAHELGIKISYTPPGATGGIGSNVNYKFNYEKSSTTKDSTSNKQHKSFELELEKTLNPHSAASYRIMLTKTRYTVSYTATVIAHFSAELNGFLRWGGGSSGNSKNYHNDYKGSGSRPTVNYRFGSARTPFYTDLKTQSNRNMLPWLWTEMKNRYSGAQDVINLLTDERRYEFTLTGKFDDVIGQHAEVRWTTENLDRKKRSLIGKQPLDEEGFSESLSDEDPPETFPAPPVVTITPRKYVENIKPEKVLG